MTSETLEKMDFFNLAQQDYHVLEEMILSNPKILTTKDDVRALGKAGNFFFKFLFFFSSQSQRLLLHWAALGGRARLLEAILSRPDAPDVDIRDDTENTPLILAVLKGSLDCVKLLVARGAQVNVKNAQGHSPIQYACSKGHKDVLEFLLTSKADPNVGDFRQDTPLHRLASLGRVEILKMLLDWPGLTLNLDAQNKEGNTPLHIAAEDDQNQVAMMLVEKGARVDVQNKEKKTVLDIRSVGLKRQIKAKLGIAD